MTSSKAYTRAEKELLVRAYAEKARRKFIDYCSFIRPGFKRAKHLELLAEKLEAVERGDIKRLIVTMPPRHGKSETTSKIFPTWYLGRNPNRRVIHASYSANLSSTFSWAARNFITSKRYRAVFPITVRQDVRARDHWDIVGPDGNELGGMISAGVGGSITGHGADLFLIDDPIKDHREAESETHREHVWEWYRTVAQTRLEPNGAVIIIMTRWHRGDLVGKLLEEAKKGGEDAENWEVLNLPALIETEDDEDNDPLGRKIGEALWPERYSASVLRKRKRSSGSRNWNSLFQGRPMDPEGQKFKREWFEANMYDALPIDNDAFGGIDTATSKNTSADNSAFVTVYRNKHSKLLFVDDSICEKFTVTGFAKTVVNVNATVKYKRIWLESNNSGESIRQRIVEVGREPGNKIPKVRAIATTTDKMVRAMEFQHLVETGIVKWNRKSPGVRALIERLINFDGKGGDVDDDVDALGFAIKAAESEEKGGVVFGGGLAEEYDPMAGVYG